MPYTQYGLLIAALLALFSCSDNKTEPSNDHRLIKKNKSETQSNERQSNKYAGKDYELDTPFPKNLAGVFKVDNEYCITDLCDQVDPGIITDFSSKIIRRRSKTHELVYVIDSIYPNIYTIDSSQILVSHISIRDTVEDESFALRIQFDPHSKLYTIYGFPQYSEFDMLYDTLFADKNHSDHIPHYAEICY